METGGKVGHSATSDIGLSDIRSDEGDWMLGEAVLVGDMACDELLGEESLDLVSVFIKGKAKLAEVD